MSYKSVTELPGQKASKEQLDMLYTRYKFASQFCQDKKVLEIACGAGFGLSLIAEKAKEVIACDVDEEILNYARKAYRNNKKIKIMKIDANKKLPFSDKRFDVIILFEALYYLENTEKTLKEIFRVLKKSGILLICLPNKNIEGFNPSPLSKKYFSVPELNKLFSDFGFGEAKIYGSCKIKDNIESKIISLIKIFAIKFNLIPKTMEGKGILKRIFFGRLEKIPEQIEDEKYEYLPLIALDNNKINKSYKVLF